MNKKTFSRLMLFAFLIVALSCKKETQPAEENDNELITTIQLDFTDRASNEVVSFSWEDGDGPGGDLPVMDTISISANKVYDVKVSFWNKSVTPAEDLTAEVKAESPNHRIYYEVNAGSGITLADFDNDTNGMPLGITTSWTTTTSSMGTVVVVLRHYPDGGKEAVDPVNSAKSSTDAGAIFEVAVVD